MTAATFTAGPGAVPRRRLLPRLMRAALITAILLLALGALLMQGLASLPWDLDVSGNLADGWLQFGSGQGGIGAAVGASLALAAGVLLLVLLPLALLGGLLSLGLLLALVVGLPLLLVLLVVALPLGLLLLPLLLLWWLLS